MAKTLNSWKEIAAYFGVTARTAQDWEKTGGLPVHRWPKGARPRVFADPDELDAWRQSSQSLGHGKKPPMGGATRSTLLKTRVAYTVGLIGLFGILGFVLWYFNGRPGQPSHARMEGILLRVFDDSGRLCWEHEFPELYQEKYRGQTFPWNGDPRNRFIQVADIDGDNTNETLIRYIPANLETGDTLFCFGSDGSVRWTFKYGRQIKIRGTEFTGGYSGVFNLPIRSKTGSYVLTVAVNELRYPTQVALLDTDGNLVDEYWHPGWFYSYLFLDVDNDQFDEVLFGGVNNPGPGIGHAVLTALKIPFAKSTDNADNFFGRKNAKEFFYALFPNPDVIETQSITSGIYRIDSIENNQIRLLLQVRDSVGPSYFFLDKDFAIIQYVPGDDAIGEHDKYFTVVNPMHRVQDEEISAWGRMLVVPTAPDGNSPEIEEMFKNLSSCEEKRTLPCIQIPK